MPINPAARQSDPIGHASVLGGVLKFGTGLVSAAITTLAYNKVVKYGRQAFKVFTGASALTGPGFLAAAGEYLHILIHIYIIMNKTLPVEHSEDQNQSL
jgi:hypothetical protein